MGDSTFENKSFVLKAVREVVIEDRPKPKLEDPHDVLVHVAQTGICGSDVSPHEPPLHLRFTTSKRENHDKCSN